MKILLIAVPALALSACEQAGDATLNETNTDTDMVVETESAAAVNEMVAEENSAAGNVVEP